MSQIKNILNHLKSGSSITATEALNLFGCFRLAARIHDLRNQGHWIQSVESREGNKSFAEYRLIKTNHTDKVASV